MSALRRLAGTARRDADVILVGVLSVLATVPFGRLYVSGGFVWKVAGAALVAVVAVLLLGRRSVLLTIVASSATFAGYLMLVVFHSGPATAWNGLTGTWSDLLTSTIPAVASPALLAAPVMLGFAAALAGGLLAVRTDPSAAPLAPPLLVLVVALAFAGTRAPGSLAYPVVLLLVILALLLVRADPSRRAAFGGSGTTLGSGRSLLALGGVSVAAVLFVTAVPAGSTSSRFDLRARYNPPLDIGNQITPLAELQPWLNDPSRTPIFTVSFSGIPAGMKLTLIPAAILESYDGAVWGTTASFALAGRDLPPGPAPVVGTVPIQQTYHLYSYPSIFLPALERPRTVKGRTLGFDRGTGMLVAPAGTNLTGTYSVVSDRPASIGNPDTTNFSSLRIHGASDPSLALLTLPPSPEGWTQEIETFAGQYASGRSPLARLVSLDNTLRSNAFGYTTHARPGHSLGVIDTFLQASGDPDHRLGDSEQFAAAFAALARYEGFPSRVVVGYRIPPARNGVPVKVVPSDIYAWTEVNLNGVGWVAFDPTNTKPRAAPPPPARTIRPVTPTTLPGSNQGQGGNGGEQSVIPRHHSTQPVWPLVLLAILLAVPSAILLAKAWRKRRRHERGGPDDQIIGAWMEARDRMQDRRLHVGRATTPTEAAEDCADAERIEVASRLRELGPLVDRALYAPDPSGDADAKAAWDLEAALEGALQHDDDPIGRIVAALDPRTLVGAGRGRPRQSAPLIHHEPE